MSKKKEKDEPKTEETALAKPEFDMFEVMDQADEDAIVAEYRELGKVNPQRMGGLVYQIKEYPPSLSIYGVREAIRHLVKTKKMRHTIRDVVTKDDGENIYVTLVIRNEITGEEYGGAAQSEKRDKRGEPDRFAIVKAYNKAERNAFRKFLPEKALARFIREFSGRGKVIDLTPVPQRPVQDQKALPASKPVATTTEEEEGMFG